MPSSPLHLIPKGVVDQINTTPKNAAPTDVDGFTKETSEFLVAMVLYSSLKMAALQKQKPRVGDAGFVGRECTFN